MCPCFSSYISCYNMQCYLSYKHCLTFILPNFLNECKLLSDVSYGYCWKCCAINYQIQHTGKICQEVIQKWLRSTLASQMQKNKATKKSISYCIDLSGSGAHLVQLSSQRWLPTTGPSTLCFCAPWGRKGRSQPALFTDLSTTVFSFEEDDGTHEEDRGVPDPEWLIWPVTSFVESLCLQLISPTAWCVCCPRNVRRTGCLGRGISQCSRMDETFLTAQQMHQGD